LGAWQTTDNVAVAIPDITRPLDCRPALQALQAHLRGTMRVVIGLGLHRPMRPDELQSLAPWNPVQHNPDDTTPTTVIDGIPGHVGRPIANADWSISIGIAELHQYAGISGGHKGVAVGCGGRDTIAALHHRDQVTAPGVSVGQLKNNPFRAAIDSLGEAARCRLALVYVPAADQWLSGNPRQVIVEARKLIAPWVPIATNHQTALLHVPDSKAMSLYQASRAATYLALSPAPPIQDGGVLVLQAACPEGLGTEAGFIKALSEHRPPWTALLTGRPPTGPGAQRAVMLAMLTRRFRLRITGCQSAETLRKIGIDATEAPANPRPDWLMVPSPFQKIPQAIP